MMTTFKNAKQSLPQPEEVTDKIETPAFRKAHKHKTIVLLFDLAETSTKM